MKIVRIALENLHSLYGAHAVDLEEDLGGAPLFLIRGPTGAGKSTLMDAVALALFGQTPRFGRDAAGAAEDPRQVMSRGTGEARAQVEFTKPEDGRIVRYRATWACHRARKRPDGELQAPRRTLERLRAAGEWETLVSDHRVGYFQRAFDAALDDMTIEDFKRMVLLPQGEFAAFLKASEAQRAAILERLTETDDFRAIGHRAYVRRQKTAAEVERLKGLRDGVPQLAPEEEERLRAALAEREQRGAAARLERDRVRASLSWRERRGELVAGLEQAAARERAAAEARAARDCDLLRLAEHERCAAAGALLVELDRIRGEVGRERALLPGLVATEAQTATALAGDVAARDAAAATVDERARARQDAAPGIQQARAVRARLREARGGKDGARGERAQSETALAAADQALAAARGAGAAAALAKDAADAQRAACQAARPLVEALAGIEAEAQAVAADRAALRRRRDGLDERRRRLAALEDELAQLAGQLAAAEPDVAAAAQVVHAAEAAFVAALDGASGAPERRAALRGREQALGRRRQALADLRRLLGERGEHERAVRADEELLAALAGELAAVAAQEAAAEAARAAAEDARQAAGQELDDLRWAQQVAKERDRLHEGEPCPLCGGREHPYLRERAFEAADRAVAERCERLERERQESEAAWRRADGALGGLRTRRAALEGRRETLAEAAAATGARLAALAAPLWAAEQALGAGEDAPSADLVALGTALEQEDGAITGALETLTAAERTRATAAERLAGARARRDQLVAARERQGAAAGELRAGLEAGAAEVAERGGELRERAESLCARLTSFGAERVDGPDGPEFGVALAHCRSRVAAVRAADEAAARAATAVEAAARDLATAETARAAADERRSRASVELARWDEQVRGLEEESRGLLGGRDPDELERALETAEQEARAAWTELSRRAHQREAALADARARTETVRARLAEHEAAEKRQQAALTEALAGLGLPDEGALRPRLLAAGEQRTLTELRQQLDGACATAGELARARAEELAAHDGVRPPGPPEDEGGSAEALAERLRALEAEVDALATEAADARAVLAQAAREKERFTDLDRQLREAKRTDDLWQRLAGLIGTNDGEAFKRFAQILNLEELLVRANAHLRELEPRYALVPARGADDQPLLAFSVRDEWQAGDIRTVKSLSGGETFLASLALALGLAAFRTARTPIETLLLDEGFGSLDGDTLRVALAALQKLNQQGTQIGIISHVEGLKGAIPASIVVEKLGGGRSRLSVERVPTG
jgi:exonuclease SbcC